MTQRDVLRRVRGSMPAFAAGVFALAVATWVVNGRPSSAAGDAGRPIMRTDAVSRIARDRARSVVLLHSIVRGAPTAQGPDWYVQPVLEGLGSGIVIDSQGLILTNAHVIQARGQIHVRRPDGEDVDATVVGTDPESDLALVRVSDATGLSPAPLGDSDRIDVGSFVVAIGSPLGLHHTVTAGVLSAKARGLDRSGMEFLQTDAAVNPGSSGGPLLDLSGRVIGVITSILSGSGENVGLNFAIPINTVKELLPSLRANMTTHGWLGITTVGLSAAGARQFGLARPDEGLLISSVEANGPAAEAGVQPLDILLGLAGESPAGAMDVFRRMRSMPPGTRVQLRILRDGRRLELPVTLGTRPQEDENATRR